VENIKITMYNIEIKGKVFEDCFIKNGVWYKNDLPILNLGLLAADDISIYEAKLTLSEEPESLCRYAYKENDPDIKILN